MKNYAGSGYLYIPDVIPLDMKLSTFKLGPHPDLLPGPKKVIEYDYDYGMKNGEKAIPVKKASLLYFYRKMVFPPNEQQVVLLNADEIQRHLPRKSVNV